MGCDLILSAFRAVLINLYLKEYQHASNAIFAFKAMTRKQDAHIYQTRCKTFGVSPGAVGHA